MKNLVKNHICLALIILLTLNACTTRTLWEKENYNEIIKEYLISTDGNQIVFLGQKYHYIFEDDSGVIKKLLQWNGKKKLQMNIYNFEAISENEVKLSVFVNSLSEKNLLNQKLPILSSEEINFLKALGFTENKVGKEIIFRKRFDLDGMRYLPRSNVNYDIGSSLSKDYKVSVKINYDSALNKAKKIALTPLTITGDSVTIIVGVGSAVVLIAIAMPLVLINCLQPKSIVCH